MLPRTGMKRVRLLLHCVKEVMPPRVGNQVPTPFECHEHQRFIPPLSWVSVYQSVWREQVPHSPSLLVSVEAPQVLTQSSVGSWKLRH